MHRLLVERIELNTAITDAYSNLERFDVLALNVRYGDTVTKAGRALALTSQDRLLVLILMFAIDSVQQRSGHQATR